MGAAWVSMELGTRGPLTSECTACAASNMAIGEALDAIRLGRADVMFAGGTEAGSPRSASAASRPCARSRGATTTWRARAARSTPSATVRHGRGRRDRRPRGARARENRGAKVYAELIGYGVSSDAQHITEPDPTGKHPARAMAMAMDDAGISGDDIDYINAHGTSTPIGDASETRVIKIALGEEKARKTPISSTKGATGHCLGASGRSRRSSRRSPSSATSSRRRSTTRCRPGVRPRLHPERGARVETDVALSNNFGFGGHNACLVIRKFRD